MDKYVAWRMIKVIFKLLSKYLIANYLMWLETHYNGCIIVQVLSSFMLMDKQQENK